MIDEKFALARNLARLQKTHGISASELARRTGISRKTYQNWSAGAVPNVRQLKALANYFSLSIDELCYGETTVKGDVQPFKLDGTFEVILRPVDKMP